MIGIKTNRPEYRNDIAEEIRLFLGIVEIALVEKDERADADLDLVFQLNLVQTGDAYRLHAAASEFTVSESFLIPAGSGLERKKQEKRHIKLATFHLLKRLYPDVSTPWGSLTGIRPTKLFRELTKQGGEAKAKETFLSLFEVSEEKTELAASICKVQTPFVSCIGKKDLDIYIGIPFCKTRCLYCSFASEVMGKEDRLHAYLAALKQDITLGGEIVREGGYRVRAIYIGGGTPTVLTADQLEALLDHALSTYGNSQCELTVEAGRPDTIDRSKLMALRGAGVDRISINPQTMHDDTLRRIGRAHTVQETEAAFYLARECGFQQINMDLIAGLPGENLAAMEESLYRIGSLMPDNLTVHALAIKRSSLLKKCLAQYPLPDAEETSRMISASAAAAASMGMVPYYMYRQKYMSGNLENVGYAEPDKVCVYNIDMMEETASILSHGAGSMTKRVFGDQNRIERLPSPKDVPTYLNKLQLLTDEKRQFFLD